MRPLDECPDLETLALLAEGRMRGEEAETLQQHLASCNRCFEIYSGVLHFQLEETRLADATGPTVTSFDEYRRSRGRGSNALGRWLLAASVLAALGLVLVWRSLQPAPSTSATLLASFAEGAALSASLSEDWMTASWSSSRGRQGPDGARHSALRLGVRSVELAVALRAGNREDGIRLSRELGATVDPFDASGEVPSLYDQLERRLESGESLDDLRASALDAEGELVTLLPEAEFNAGRVLAAGRVAAHVGYTDFFSSRSWRRSLSRLEAQTEEGAVLEAVREVADGPGSSPMGEYEAKIRSLIGLMDERMAIAMSVIHSPAVHRRATFVISGSFLHRASSFEHSSKSPRLNHQ